MSEFNHLCSEERLVIERMLKERYSFKAIAKEINKHCTTVSKEIKRP